MMFRIALKTMVVMRIPASDDWCCLLIMDKQFVVVVVVDGCNIVLFDVILMKPAILSPILTL